MLAVLLRQHSLCSQWRCSVRSSSERPGARRHVPPSLFVVSISSRSMPSCSMSTARPGKRQTRRLSERSPPCCSMRQRGVNEVLIALKFREATRPKTSSPNSPDRTYSRFVCLTRRPHRSKGEHGRRGPIPRHSYHAWICRRVGGHLSRLRTPVPSDRSNFKFFFFFSPNGGLRVSIDKSSLFGDGPQHGQAYDTLGQAIEHRRPPGVQVFPKAIVDFNIRLGLATLNRRIQGEAGVVARNPKRKSTRA